MQDTDNTTRRSLIEELMDLVTKFNTIPLEVIKGKLHMECAKRYDDFNGRINLAKAIGLPIETYTSYTNKSHPSGIKLEKLIEICYKLDIDIYTLFDPIGYNTLNISGSKKRWTNEGKLELIEHCNNYGIESASKKFKLKVETIELYLSKWKEENIGE